MSRGTERSVDEIERDIEHGRSRIDSLANDLAERMQPSNLIDEAAGSLGRRASNDLVAMFRRMGERHPAVTTLASMAALAIADRNERPPRGDVAPHGGYDDARVARADPASSNGSSLWSDPLVLGAVALGVGIVAGTLIPSARRDREPPVAAVPPTLPPPDVDPTYTEPKQ